MNINNNENESDVFRYFLDLNSTNLRQSRHSYLYNTRDYQRVDYKTSTANLPEDTIYIKGKPFYYKPWRKVYSINSITTSDMYNKCGLLTPPVYKLTKKHNFEISQDVNSIDDTVSILAKNLEEVSKLKKELNLESYKWTLLYNKDIKEAFLKFMSKECFEEFVLMFIFGELKTDVDGHTLNYFFHKNNNASKFEKVIPIDLELSRILDFTKYQEKPFTTFLNRKYDSYCPYFGLDGYISYKDRMKHLKEIVNDGVLSDSQIKKIKDFLNYDFPENFQENLKKYIEKDKNNQAYNLFARLWEYNRESLGKELNL